MREEHPNVKILKQFNSRDSKDSQKMLSEEFIWHYINPKLEDVQGDYLGPTGLQEFFDKMSRRSNGTFEFNPVFIKPIGQELVFVHVSKSMRLDEQIMTFDAVVVWRVVGGKIMEAWDIPGVHSLAASYF